MRVAQITLTAFVAAVLFSPAAKADDIYAYEVNGKTWFSNYCPKDAKKCKLVMRSWSNSGAKKGTDAAASGTAGASKTTARRWKPPKTVQFKTDGAPEISSASSVDQIIEKASSTYNMPEAFIRAVIEVESSYKTRALSYKGAMGLMQLMPGTAADLGVTDPYDPYQNVMGGTKFLRILANRFDGDIPKVLAAYHAGGSSVDMAEGIPFQGTDGYVRKVLDHYYRLKTGLGGVEE